MVNITAGGMSGGYRNYLANLVPRLAAHPEVSSLLVGVPRGIALGREGRGNGSVQWLSLRWPASPVGGGLIGLERRTIDQFAPDVLFIPTSRFCSFGSVPVVNMVRNMMPMTPHNSGYCLERIRNWARFRQMRRAVSQSNRVIAISQFVKDYLTGELGLAEDRVGVVHHGTDLHPDASLRKPDAVSADYSGRFVFTAGLIYPYRGLEDLIDARCHLRCLTDLPPLVIAGKVGQGMSRYYARLRRIVRERNLESCVHFVGLLGRPEMTWCYRNCAAFVMTSRVEACPNIALEAMANGSLCISTKNPPLPEMFADAAWYYPAGESRALADRIGDVLRLPHDQQEIARKRAVARAAQFSWDACCGRTIEELQKVVRSAR
ncbi:MAG TPA: glycosyltransferase [Sedimentisphaerales bacterium]|nr:glycosyltransferase [Sedimentisphaerales bacterium]